MLDALIEVIAAIEGSYKSSKVRFFTIVLALVGFVAAVVILGRW